MSAEWLPTSRVVYQPPEQRVGDLVHYKSGPTVGPREARETQLLMQHARAMQPQPDTLPNQMHTTYGDQFTTPGPTGMPCVPRPVTRCRHVSKRFESVWLLPFKLHFHVEVSLYARE